MSIAIQLKSTITCPECEVKSTEKMPQNACQFFWQCPDCKTTIRPKSGDCCVYCSYGDVQCPPKQLDKSCC